MVTLLLLCLNLLTSWKATDSPNDTYAVVVGISDYQSLTSRTGDLRFADRDARQIVTFLQSKAGGSVPSAHIRLLINRQATSATIKQSLSLFEKAKPGDRVIFYFSGHGLPSSFVPYDIRPGNQQLLVTYQDIKTAFRQSKAATKLCIADACLSGGMAAQKSTQRNLSQTMSQAGSKETNVALLLASRSTQSAVEASRLSGGAFTHYLLRGLNGQADLNRDRIVTIRELHQYVGVRVKQATRGRQTPIFYGRFSDNLGLAYL